MLLLHPFVETALPRRSHQWLCNTSKADRVSTHSKIPSMLSLFTVEPLRVPAILLKHSPIPETRKFFWWKIGVNYCNDFNHLSTLDNCWQNLKKIQYNWTKKSNRPQAYCAALCWLYTYPLSASFPVSRLVYCMSMAHVILIMNTIIFLYWRFEYRPWCSKKIKFPAKHLQKGIRTDSPVMIGGLWITDSINENHSRCIATNCRREERFAV